MSYTGADWVAIQAAMQQWVMNGSGLTDQQVVWGQQDAPRPPSPAITMRLSNIAEQGRMWLDTSANPLTFTDLTVTSVDTTANTFAIAAHGLLTGDGPVQLTTTGALPTASGGNLVADTDYWVIAPDADHLQLARTYADTGGGQGAGNTATPIDLTGTGSGTIHVVATADTLRAGQEIEAVSRGLVTVTLELRCHSDSATGLNMAVALLERVRGRRYLPSQQAILDGVNVGLTHVERVRAILGIRDALLFEPRAYLDIQFCVAIEESENETIIETAEITDLITGQTIDVAT